MKLNKISLLILPTILSISFAGLAGAQDAAAQVEQYPYQKTFIITSYYSPIEGQEHYIKGSLAADRKLNGNGTNGADGTPVFPGMIAAPKTIAFGTKMAIPGVGTVSVHDRGGAIVQAGVRGHEHDRLDIWMGYGDEGLKRALAWGKRTVEVTVYGPDSDVQENIDFTSLNLHFTFPAYSGQSEFSSDFGYGEKSDAVKSMQTTLTKLGYLSGEASGNFDDQTYNAVVKFQLAVGIIDDESSFGAGYFGPQTRKALQNADQNGVQNASQNIASKPLITVANAGKLDDQSMRIQYAGNGLTFLELDLERGATGQAVIELQTELRKLNFLGIEPTGYFGEVTEHAIFKFQQSQGLVADMSSLGAGRLGPLTRSKLQALVDERIGTRKIIADKAKEIDLVASK